MESFSFDEFPGLMNNMTREFRSVKSERDNKFQFAKERVRELMESCFELDEEYENTLEELIDLNMSCDLQDEFFLLLDKYETINFERANSYKLRFKNLYGV